MALVDMDLAPIWLALRQAADAIKTDAAQVIAETAHSVRRDLQGLYPVGPTGRLQRWITVRMAPRQSADPILRAWQVRAYAPHVHLYERGTRERFDPTRQNARRGRSPAHGEILARIASHHRREMIARIARLLDRDRRLG